MKRGVSKAKLRRLIKRRSIMSLRTRLDGRSEENDSFKIKNAKGEVLAVIKLLDNSGSNLEVSTQEGLYIEKPSGWNSCKEKPA